MYPVSGIGESHYLGMGKEASVTAASVGPQSRLGEGIGLAREILDLVNEPKPEYGGRANAVAPQ